MTHVSKRKDVLGIANRGDPVDSGLCTLCQVSCQGRCETWLSSLQGRKMLYPRDFGEITAGSGNINAQGVGYHALRIQGFNFGAKGLQGNLENIEDCVFTHVNLETEFGFQNPVRCKVPIMTGALGSTFIAAKYWNPLAIGAALVGFPIVIGENVVGVDREAVIENGKVIKAPELDRRIQTYLRYASDYGAVSVQVNVEDLRNGVAEYIIEKYGDQITIELKWGQGAKSIGGEIQVNSLDYALFLAKRGYVMDPDPTLARNQRAFQSGALSSFARHSRMGGTKAEDWRAFRDSFMKAVEYLKKLGFKNVSLKTGAFGMKELAMALRFGAEAKLALVTIDGAGGGTGMSPWNMMEHWGVPPLLLHSKAREYAEVLSKNGYQVPSLAFGGGLAREDHLFKALAVGAPYAKLVCMGRTLMIPAFLGSNIEGVIHPERKNKLNGQWKQLPKFLQTKGKNPDSIFVGWYEVQDLVGPEEMKNIPFGAVALWTLVDKLSTGLQQFMAGARKFNLESLDHTDLLSANRETEKETGIPYLTETFDTEARAILNEKR